MNPVIIISGSRSLGVSLLTLLMTLPSFAVLQTNVVERHYDRFGRPVGVSLNGERRMETVYDEATGRIASMRVAGADEQDSAVVEWWRVSSQSEDIGG